MPARAPDPFAYAVLRVVPELERGERLTPAVVLFCRQRGLPRRALRELDPERLPRSLPPPGAPLAELEAELRRSSRIAAGDVRAAGSPRLPISERFGWLVAPSSTMVQPSEVHTGDDRRPGGCARRALFARSRSALGPAGSAAVWPGRAAERLAGGHAGAALVGRRPDHPGCGRR